MATITGDNTADDRAALARAAASTGERAIDFNRAPIDEYVGPRSMPIPGKPVESGPVSKSVPFHASPSLHPKNVEAIEGFEDAKDLLGPVVTAFSAATNALIDIDKAKQQAKKDTSRTEANVLLQVAKFAETHQDKITRKFDAVLKAVDAQISSRETMLSAPLKSAATSSAVATEVRAHVKAMSHAERVKFLDDRQRIGDTETLSMILGAQGFLSGMSDKERAVRTRIFNESAQPIVAKQVKALLAAKEMLETRVPLFLVQIEKAMGADWRRIKRLREAHTAAEQAFIVQDHTADVTS